MRAPGPGRSVWLEVACAVALPMLACVVERESTPPKQLLRDVVAAQRTAASTAPVPALPSDASVAVPAPVTPLAQPSSVIPDAYRTCQADVDCAAVLPNGCCQDGIQVAMNKASVDAYKGSFTCPIPHPICPMHLVLDRRVPVCSKATRLCELVQPPE